MNAAPTFELFAPFEHRLEHHDGELLDEYDIWELLHESGLRLADAEESATYIADHPEENKDFNIETSFPAIRAGYPHERQFAKQDYPRLRVLACRKM